MMLFLQKRNFTLPSLPRSCLLRLLVASSHAMSAASLRLFTSAALVVAISAVRFGHYRALPLLRHCLAFAAVPQCGAPSRARCRRRDPPPRAPPPSQDALVTTSYSSKNCAAGTEVQRAFRGSQCSNGTITVCENTYAYHITTYSVRRGARASCSGELAVDIASFSILQKARQRAPPRLLPPPRCPVRATTAPALPRPARPSSCPRRLLKRAAWAWAATFRNRTPPGCHRHARRAGRRPASAAA